MSLLQPQSKLEKRKLEIGYVRLTDAAPLIVAQELGLFRAYGLNVNLRQEISWANVRDKLVAKSLDAAQLLAPLPAMTSLGASGLRAPLLTGWVLSRNGNAITLSHTLAERLAARDLAHAKPLTFATVHAFSTHTVLLRRWLRQQGLDPDVDVRTLIVPPSQMVDSLDSGVIDGFCVGEPWNSIAAQQGVGQIVAAGSEVWPGALEKVLAVTAGWHESYPQTHHCLRAALRQACLWLARTDNRAQAAQLLALPEYLAIAEPQLLPSLTGKLDLQGKHRVIDDFLLFAGEQVNRPDENSAQALLSACTELLGRGLNPARVKQLVSECYLDELYQQTTAADSVAVGVVTSDAHAPE